MQSPAFFFSILALSSTLVRSAPLAAKRPTNMPAFWQPHSVAAPIANASATFSNFATANNIGATAMTAQDAANMVEHFMLGEMNMTMNDFIVTNSFVPNQIMASATPVHKRDAPIIPADQAVLMFAQANGLAVTDKLQVKKDPAGSGGVIVLGASFAMAPILASQKYYQTADSLVHAWDLNINMMDNWQNAFVDSATGKVIAVSSWTSDAKKTAAAAAAAAKKAKAGKKTKAAAAAAAAGAAGAVAAASNPVGQAPTIQVTPGVPLTPATYNVVPMGKTDPAQNGGLTSLTSPWNLQASPNGWHVVGTTQNTDLQGNNVIAQSNPNNIADPNALAVLPRPTNSNLLFQAPFDPAQGPTLASNRDAATTNMFYVANAMHDILYNYGFTETAGNFQISNNGKGGVANDPVFANSQDGSGTNNANFASPPDGQVGIMRMFTFTLTTPNRDGALENDVVAHEIVHGLSNRLTGGPANANCLQTLEAGGMGEGWSDAFALMVSLPDTNTRTTDVITGGYVLGNTKGVRNFPFSTSTTTNPLTFSSLNTLNEVHNIGEVWTSMLFEVMWNMIDVSGKTPAAQLVSSAGANTGNSDLMLLLIQGMKMQPCNPTFIQAKAAIVAAEAAMFNGKYACAIANGFAKRGLGVNAASTGNPGAGQFTDNQDLPAGCAKTF
ncbi:UNVERIFIED_CONTAM: Fungalysin/Thermolysin Extracellular metalloproteinase 5 [Siphonaria sp. JEL0065]|nr:Fungalysin/Thermolysin Extracellular metalloproteinase 5 [Siphonaria sp. JEL0065]